MRRCFELQLFVAAVTVLAGQTFAAEPFSQLSAEQQQILRQLVEPPPLAERVGPYSTPMYYLMHRGFEYDGAMEAIAEKRCYDKSKPGPVFESWKLERNRPDWQEAMIADWADLGLNNTHLNVYPVDDSLELEDDYVQALEDFVALSHKYGLKVGVRLDALGGYEMWPVHPRNPDNVIAEYLVYAQRIAQVLKGQTAYYVLGDELYLDEPYDKEHPERTWTPEDYMDYFKQVSAAIKGVDPDAKVSMYGAESGKWRDVLKLLSMGYADHGEGVALNHYSYLTATELYDEVRRVAPQMKFYSNGVGYCSTTTAQPRYPEGDSYTPHPTEETHAAAVAKQVFGWWDAGADTVPYYIVLRNWEIGSEVYPRWFGFFGIQDFVVGEDDQLTVRRHPGWYAYQTITHTFYNRGELEKPGFTIDSSEEMDFQRAYVRKHDSGQELLLVLWNNSPIDTTLTLHTDAYAHPVKVDLLNYQDWSDLPHEARGDSVELKLTADQTPTIIRLFSVKAK